MIAYITLMKIAPVMPYLMCREIIFSEERFMATIT
jgi:hypothetical protein